jgi:hypothetical protein
MAAKCHQGTYCGGGKQVNIIALAEARKRLMQAQRRSCSKPYETWPEILERQRQERMDAAEHALRSTRTISEAAEFLNMTRPALDSFMRDYGMTKRELFKEGK